MGQYSGFGRNDAGEISSYPIDFAMVFEVHSTFVEVDLIGYEPSVPSLQIYSEYWEPLVYPGDVWMMSVLYTIYNEPGHSAWVYCAIDDMVDRGRFIYGSGSWTVTESGSVVQIDSGWTRLVQLNFLQEDSDGDSIRNLSDEDTIFSCIGIRDSDCDWFGGDNYDSNPTPGEGLPDVPQITGALDDFLGCVNPVYGGSAGEDDWAVWAATHWRDSAAWSTPNHARPYENPYNLVRAGVGGAESAYISACWGKNLAYCDRDAVNETGAYRYLGTFSAWHRYVIRDGYFMMQYWRPTDSCWTTIGLRVASSSRASIGSQKRSPNGFVELTLPSNFLEYFIPQGYMPGDFVQFTESNVDFGVGNTPDLGDGFFTDSAGFDAQGVGSSGGGGSSLTMTDLENGMYNAIADSSRGVARDGAKAMIDGLGDGGSEGVQNIFGNGSQNEGTGESIGDAGDVIDDGSSGLLGALMGAASLDGLSPAAQGVGDFSVVFPRPGGGDISVDISTMPDTSTTMGFVMNSVRVFMRLLFLLIFSWRVLTWYVELFREVT